MTAVLVLTFMAVTLAVTIVVADTLQDPRRVILDPRVVATHLIFYTTSGMLTSWTTVALMAVLIWSVTFGLTLGDRPARHT